MMHQCFIDLITFFVIIRALIEAFIIKIWFNLSNNYKQSFGGYKR
jgi:1,4-dihydroxy-2-naphthoate octaprenyltransferase